jgi:Ca-activated chloride channel family protein
MLPGETTDIFADRDLSLVARYSGHGRARVVVEGRRGTTPVTWTSTVDFPDRDRENSFVARLWATQRVGYLSAEKRKNGGSSELDDEIRALGERYGIPTEFTSYLVTERQDLPMRTAMMGAGGQAGLAPAVMKARSIDAASLAFESAKAASAQRTMSNVAAIDSLSIAVGRPMRDKDEASTIRRVDGRTFGLRDGAWTDARYHAGMQVTTIKPYSKAYFDLLQQVPELKAVFALGDRVVVVGKTRAIRVDDSGVAEMTPSALVALVSGW